MADMAVAFYKDLYYSEGMKDMGQLLNIVPAKLTKEMNEILLTLSEEEAKTMLLHMFLTKALGFDGFFGTLFQCQWDVFGDEVTTLVFRVLMGVDDPTIISNTSIVLIPKVEDPKELGQFGPISMCNVILNLHQRWPPID
jgi:hypothetical protein